MGNTTANPDSFYESHLEKLVNHYLAAVKSAGKSGVLIASGSLKTCFLDDHHYPFVVNPHFKVFAPMTDVPDSYILLRKDEQPTLLLNQPEDYWHKTPEMPNGEWTRPWHLQSISSLDDAHNLLGNAQDLAYIGEETELARKIGISSLNDTSLLAQVHFERAYKSDYELAVMQVANDIAVKGHRAAEASFRAGGSEFDIAHAYLGATSHREQHAPYSAIVALNEHCAVLHYQHYDLQRPADINSMLIDAGANYRGYAADITRTYAAAPGIFADLLNAMESEQLAIIDDITIGMNYADLHEKMNHRLANLLHRFQLLTCSVDEMLHKNLTFTFLPHGLGHLLGLQTHDVGGFQQNSKGEVVAAPAKSPALRLTRPIENRQVFTIEPGLYFIPMLLDKLKNSPEAKSVNWPLIQELLPYGGIRIEDNIGIIENKVVNLTRLAFAKE